MLGAGRLLFAQAGRGRQGSVRTHNQAERGNFGDQITGICGIWKSPACDVGLSLRVSKTCQTNAIDGRRHCTSAVEVELGGNGCMISGLMDVSPMKIPHRERDHGGTVQRKRRSWDSWLFKNNPKHQVKGLDPHCQAAQSAQTTQHQQQKGPFCQI